MLSTKKKMFFLLSCICAAMILTEEILNRKLYRFGYDGLADGVRWKKNSSIVHTAEATEKVLTADSLPVEETEDVSPNSGHLEMKSGSAATESGRIAVKKVSISRYIVSDDTIMVKDSNGEWKDGGEDDDGDIESGKSQGIAVNDERNDVNNDVDATDDKDDDDDGEEHRKLQASPYIIYKEEEERTNRQSTQGTQAPLKFIAYYMPGDIHEQRRNAFSRCAYKECVWINNMSKADAVAFRAASVRDHVIPQFHRPDGQMWILYTKDPSMKEYHLRRSDVKSSFNLTMTYQLDSDLPLLFGRLQPRKPPSKDYEKIYDSKTKDIAWFVSHCHTRSRREVYVARMLKIVNVDIFGRCGNLSCGPVHERTQDNSMCLPMLSKTYKFYLAFENSFCKDYVTEKFFKLFQDVDVIPVVRGGFDYKKYFPSGIFVDASDFRGPEDLARFLHWLGRNKEEYVKMLKRKNSWTASSFVEKWFCALCRYLHSGDKKKHFIEDLAVKFHGNPSYCRQARDL